MQIKLDEEVKNQRKNHFHPFLPPDLAIDYARSIEVIER